MDPRDPKPGHLPRLLTETAILDRIAAATTVRSGVTLGIGDDAAVLATDPPIVVTQDMLVDGVHFRRATSSFGDIGHKALAVNLSDLAAMGAAPAAAFVGLGLPDRAPLDGADLDALYRAMEELAAAHGATIAGGDVVRAAELILSVTALGTMAAGVEPVRRSGARAGDVLCVTGALGAAAAGLLILDDPALARATPYADALRSASRRPTPRVSAGGVLARGGVSAMMDCSDGLAIDALRLARASGVTVEIDLDRIPLAPGVAAVARATGRSADELAATGGDDYELIVTAPPERLALLGDGLGIPLTAVGRVRSGPPALVTLRDGRPVRLASLGWEHTPGDPG